MIEKLVSHYVPYNASDEELARLFIESKDNRYFEQLYERYAFKVHQKCLFLTRDASKAEDVTHDVFLKLIFKMNTFKKDAKFSTWLFSITYNHCMDLMRTSKRRIVTVHEADVDLIDDDFDIHKIFDLEEVDTTSLKVALKHLNLEEKAMIYLKYLDNRTIRDIADIFNVTESAMKMRLMRSREKLRKRYLETILFG
ncbi:RNA polymerase sigma factor [Dyadobacter arcticus]|uniref:RNA polymerase sigma-70 factor (ECF subfamily) n=1 Tax=Dyadobacter arcticus TaxID=1078754 RepID=A0ABX0UDI1_9BACT|nr:RNA polymerase sigma factor [Dyadobacter arcticus]NIJ51064.1 RNA polymerase sigma-70 factor (ECF subfamily) [Dyadobacter arcticus]